MQSLISLCNIANAGINFVIFMTTVTSCSALYFHNIITQSFSVNALVCIHLIIITFLSQYISIHLIIIGVLSQGVTTRFSSTNTHLSSFVLLSSVLAPIVLILDSPWYLVVAFWFTPLFIEGVRGKISQLWWHGYERHDELDLDKCVWCSIVFDRYNLVSQASYCQYNCLSGSCQIYLCD